MQHHSITKYRPYPSIPIVNRDWPNRQITKAPIWCSVDLRDGNQALINPMDLEKKLEFFQELLRVGFKEIEIGFPSASETEFQFCRTLIEKKMIPDDVTIQVLVQCRENLIRKTFEAISGAKSVIVHFYNSTNPLQRRVTFQKDKQAIKNLACEAARLCKTLQLSMPADMSIRFEYSPESFSDTELDFSLEICEAVMDEIRPTLQNPLILNLPATMELFTPNVHADQIEYFCRHIKNRESVIISLHTHNDRGTTIAATELGLLAGADRVEGTLFGNGERTGNCDLLVLALNLYSQGIDPHLDFSDIDRTRRIYERCTELLVHPRHPYAGDLVFTAFSGSHQDAIKKGMEAREKNRENLWQVPYLTIDPEDLGRGYESIIRVNGQSGKGGTAYILKSRFGIDLPKNMQPQVYEVIQKESDRTNQELIPEKIYQLFEEAFLISPLVHLEKFDLKFSQDFGGFFEGRIFLNGKIYDLQGKGNGPVDAFSQALKVIPNLEFSFEDFYSQALQKGADAEALSYIALKDKTGKVFWGAGKDRATDASSIKAFCSALSRMIQASK